MAAVSEAAREVTVTIPYKPRPQQLECHNAIAAHRWSVLVCHRRFGKTVGLINHLQRDALTSKRDRAHFGYIGPSYRQAKAVAWEYLKHFASPIPGIQVNESELWVQYPNRSRVRLFGGDNPDSLRGMYFDGVALDEYGMMRSELFSSVIRPGLADREGYGVFAGTPNGKNQFYDEAMRAQRGDSGYLYLEFKASKTGILPQSELDEAKRHMTHDEYQQEFECSFEASVRGAIFAAEMIVAKDEGRVTRVGHAAELPVHTIWDLGVGDATAIWFVQQVGPEVRVIDYYEASGEGIPHYAKMLQTKPYVYGRHIAPHDINVRELGSGRSRIETAESHGIKFETAPNVPIEDGIHAARLIFKRCWFDAEKCAAGLDALTHYRRDFNQRLGEFKATPIHDWSSHGADAFRYMALSLGSGLEVKARRQNDYRASESAYGWMA